MQSQSSRYDIQSHPAISKYVCTRPDARSDWLKSCSYCKINLRLFCKPSNKGNGHVDLRSFLDSLLNFTCTRNSTMYVFETNQCGRLLSLSLEGSVSILSMDNFSAVLFVCTPFEHKNGLFFPCQTDWKFSQLKTAVAGIVGDIDAKNKKPPIVLSGKIIDYAKGV